MFTSKSPEVVAWLAACQKLITDYYTQNLPKLSIPTLSIDEGSKLLKIVKKEQEHEYGSAFAFIAKCDNFTKALGNVKAGDILKVASFSQAAKGARGNLLDNHNGLGRMSAYGPEYNR